MGGWEQCSSNSLVICGLPFLLSKIFIQSICSCQFNTLWLHKKFCSFTKDLIIKTGNITVL